MIGKYSIDILFTLIMILDYQSINSKFV